MKFVKFLKNWLIFNIFYCFWMFVNKLFTYITCAYLKKKGILTWNLQYIDFIWRQRYWKSFKSALVYHEINYFKYFALVIYCCIYTLTNVCQKWVPNTWDFATFRLLLHAPVLQIFFEAFSIISKKNSVQNMRRTI